MRGPMAASCFVKVSSPDELHLKGAIEALLLEQSRILLRLTILFCALR